MPLNIAQKIVLVVGFLSLAMALVWVPYKATFAREGDNYNRDIGYALLFDPPQQSGCEVAFGDKISSNRLNVACTVNIQTTRVLMTASAIGIATIAITLSLGLFSRKKHQNISLSSREKAANKTMLWPPSTPVAPPSLADKLRSEFQKLPISTGEATEDSPLIITAKKDYIGVEYAVAEYLLKREELSFELSLQALQHRGDRSVDILTFDVKPKGVVHWNAKRTFYFDITAGYSKLRGWF